MRIHALWLSASVLTLGWCGAAAAQTTTDNNNATASSADEAIVVTAERRATRLDRTPIAATVLTGEDLANHGVTTGDQLQFITPAATINNFGQGVDFNIRGIGKGEHNSQTSSGVIVYRDNVATSSGYFTAEPYYDIRSVEILRGPQGTFLGQNANGGAVFVTSNDPIIGGGVHGYALGQVGNYNELGGQGAINIPISDTLAARVAFYGESRDSFYDITGPFTGDDGVRIAAGRVSLLWTPSASLTVRFKTDADYEDLSGNPADPVNSPNDIFRITSNARLTALDRFVRSSLRADYQFGSGITLRSVTAYQQGNTGERTDLDGTSVGTSTFRDYVPDTIRSQELDLISPDGGPITWTLGAYYQDEDLSFPPGDFVIHIPAGNYTLDGHNLRDNRALFGQVSFNLPAGFQLQVGARYSESSTANHGHINQFGLPLILDQREEFSNTSGKVSLNWTVDEHNFLYAFAATGFRPGGLNVPVGLGVPAPFDSEHVREYEIGWKSGMFGGHLRTQLDAFYNDYDNFQVIIGYPAFPTFGFELNVPNSTKVYGAELQAEAVFGDFSLDAGLALMRSDLGQFFAVDPRSGSFVACDPSVGPASASCINLEGRDQTYAPNFTFNVGMQYDFHIAGGSTLTPRVNLGHVSQQWATLFENTARGDRIESRDVWNAQLAWQHDDLTVTLYGTNVSDQHYVAAINSGLRLAGPPQQYGIRLMKTF